MSINIANLSLDIVGEEAQGINRVLISVVNQQEEVEKKKGGGKCERICMYAQDKKKKHA